MKKIMNEMPINDFCIYFPEMVFKTGEEKTKKKLKYSL